jgi:hypothetical protein
MALLKWTSIIPILKLDDLRTAMEKINQFVKVGRVVSEAEASPILRTALEKLDAISKNINQTLVKPPLGQQKGVNQNQLTP